MMEANFTDAEIKRAFIQSAKCLCLKLDGDKFDHSALVSVGSLETIDIVSTGRKPSNRWVERYGEADVKLVC